MPNVESRRLDVRKGDDSLPCAMVEIYFSSDEATTRTIETFASTKQFGTRKRSACEVPSSKRAQPKSPRRRPHRKGRERGSARASAMGCETRNPTKLQERVVTGWVFASRVRAAWCEGPPPLNGGAHTRARLAVDTLNPKP